MIPLTYFEFGTLAALWLFERSEPDLAILEVGLGGRLDAVNLVDPDVAVITTVDLDHQDWLGNDREAIGFEKAGIARAWKPLVLGEDDPPASVLRRAYAIGASAIRAGCDFFVDPPAPDSGAWRWREIGFELELPPPQLAAPVQLRNAATAIAALRALDAQVEDGAFAQGVSGARMPGRLQRFERNGAAVLVDVGHNPQAAAVLADALRNDPSAGRTFAVYAALADKDHRGVVEALAERVDGWLLAGTEETGARGLSGAALAQRLPGTAAESARAHADVHSALQAALAQARPGDRILVFGSFHAAAQALQALNAP
jgi:dihydrofolate synthase/folylpolyglutamate synthase